ncbi:HdeD family acid-resistance protein [Flavisphingomonas formosensis]|uniref:HdeD family acid-resistance protein n=1 Tax=Flavisphingomonas formosensis TaxID=861534 RepID=UPI0012FB74F3|nr:DUF308 domain-containing protein [Sphingomonas formosensis]
MASAHSHARWVRHRGNWGWILAYGLVSIGIGVLALAEPLATGFATGLFLATLLILGGAIALAAGFSTRGWHNHWLDIVTGLVAIALGLLIIWHPFLGAISIVWFIGAWLFTGGILELVAGFRATEHRGMLILLGIVDMVLGLYLFLAGPLTALFVLALLVGLSFLFRGAMLCLLALRLRRLARS